MSTENIVVLSAVCIGTGLALPKRSTLKPGSELQFIPWILAIFGNVPWLCTRYICIRGAQKKDSMSHSELSRLDQAEVVGWCGRYASALPPLMMRLMMAILSLVVRQRFCIMCVFGWAAVRGCFDIACVTVSVGKKKQ